MTKKIILISLFILFAGALIAGGIYRTSAKSGYDISLGGENGVEITQNSDSHTPRALGAEEGQQGGERQGQGLGNGGQGQGRNRKTEEAVPHEEGANGQGRGGQGKEYDGNGGQGQGQQGEGYGSNGGGQGQGQSQGQQGQGQGQQGQGQGQGQGQQGQGQGQNQQGNYDEAHDMILIEGTISQAPAAGVDMIIETESGQVLIGTGPGWLQEQGFELANGETVQVSGYYENDEFKAVTITRLSDGQDIALRDEFGRPMWSGAGRRAQGGQGQGQSYEQQNQNSTGI